ncbi:MAG TPA: MarR family winged helix-turn-helix transcriptional regulator [Streptosporangiaceae bacterium]|nr:MarR family winged helix-turn-helix transcriptional regulator [Streptosporangiaceae bacterium]
MQADLTEPVRRFNRTVTERIGALSDDYLARSRPLGASRVLWEIGTDGADVRSLRARLRLDSGYLSRLLRGLEAEGLVAVQAGDGDRRVRAVTLTAAGRAERAELDRLSDAHAKSLLAPLTGRQRDRLIEAMGTVERLLTASLVEIGGSDPASEAAQFCLKSYFSELETRFDDGFDTAAGLAGAAGYAAPGGLLLVARLRDEPVGCGALCFLDGEPDQVKRMWVARSARGLGLGRRLLAELEQRVRERGGRAIRLETNRRLAEAISLYRSAGYVEVPPFNDEPYAHHWFEKQLPPR